MRRRPALSVLFPLAACGKAAATPQPTPPCAEAPKDVTDAPRASQLDAETLRAHQDAAQSPEIVPQRLGAVITPAVLTAPQADAPARIAAIRTQAVCHTDTTVLLAALGGGSGAAEPVR